jgi:hypothetical protein
LPPDDAPLDSVVPSVAASSESQPVAATDSASSAAALQVVTAQRLGLLALHRRRAIITICIPRHQHASCRERIRGNRFTFGATP